MSVFDIIGPVMIGPSSSHTAGAVKLGNMARNVIGHTPERVEIVLHGSFARTYKGHATDLALVAGLLGMRPDDERIPQSFRIAAESGMQFRIDGGDLGDVHPNSARFSLSWQNTGAIVEGSSVGGGAVVLTGVDGFALEYTGSSHALLVFHLDRPGSVAAVTSVLAASMLNIGAMRVSRKEKGSEALMLIEVDQEIPGAVVARVSSLEQVRRVIYFAPLEDDD
ncbi:MAG: L-serine ammonia-lyase, iron-sulfur-dependent subunit beta [Bacillota bacterium]